MTEGQDSSMAAPAALEDKSDAESTDSDESEFWKEVAAREDEYAAESREARQAAFRQKRAREEAEVPYSLLKNLTKVEPYEEPASEPNGPSLEAGSAEGEGHSPENKKSKFDLTENLEKNLRSP